MMNPAGRWRKITIEFIAASIMWLAAKFTFVQVSEDVPHDRPEEGADYGKVDARFNTCAQLNEIKV